MSQQIKSISSRFLNELHSSRNQELFEMLNYLLEELENKNDPEPKELRIVDLSYQVIEKIKMLESILKDYTLNSNKPDGTRLQDLYDKIPSNSDSSVLFE